MPVVNIIDHRKNSYKSTRVTVSYIETWHDNSQDGADQYREPDEYECISLIRRYISVRDAIDYADRWKNAITLHLYDMNVESD